MSTRVDQYIIDRIIVNGVAREISVTQISCEIPPEDCIYSSWELVLKDAKVDKRVGRP